MNLDILEQIIKLKVAQMKELLEIGSYRDGGSVSLNFKHDGENFELLLRLDKSTNVTFENPVLKNSETGEVLNLDYSDARSATRELLFYTRELNGFIETLTEEYNRR